MKSPSPWIIALAILAAPLLSSGTGLGQTMMPAPSPIPRPKIIVPVKPYIPPSCPLHYLVKDVVMNGNLVAGYKCVVPENLKSSVESFGGCPSGYDAFTENIKGGPYNVQWERGEYICKTVCDKTPSTEQCASLSLPADPCATGFQKRLSQDFKAFSCMFPNYTDTEFAFPNNFLCGEGMSIHSIDEVSGTLGCVPK
jgi:hypothetical protein